jgi:inosose dehydratase
MTVNSSAIRVANAPCSWGTLEVDAGGERIGYRQMLDELKDTGYVGTELGDWGFMPTEPAGLRSELAARGLAMVGAYVQVAFKDAAAHADGEERALRVARLLAAVAERGESDGAPFVILADDNGTDPVRTRFAGRVTPELGLSAAEWATFARGVERVAQAVRAATGLRTLFHPHCAGYVETPDEIARFAELTDPELVGFVLDTGHIAYGAGADGRAGEAVLDRYGDRVRHVHFKDCDPAVAARARAEGWGYFEALGNGVFCELGRGCVDFPSFLAKLGARGYGGWIVVEQDVLPGMGTPRESAARNRAYLASLGL